MTNASDASREQRTLFALVCELRALEIGVRTPQQFAIWVTEDDTRLHMLRPVLQLALAAQRFALSPCLGRALSHLPEPLDALPILDLPSLSASSLLLSLADHVVVPSSALQRLRTNAKRAAKLFGWPLQGAVSVLYQAHECQVFELAAAVLVRTERAELAKVQSPIPSLEAQLSASRATLYELQQSASKTLSLLQSVDMNISKDFYRIAMNVKRTTDHDLSNWDKKPVAAMDTHHSPQQHDGVQSCTIESHRLLTAMVHEASLLCSGAAPLNWYNRALALTSFLIHGSVSHDAWWLSWIRLVQNLHGAENEIALRYVCVLPFLSNEATAKGHSHKAIAVLASIDNSYSAFAAFQIARLCGTDSVHPSDHALSKVVASSLAFREPVCQVLLDIFKTRYP